MWAFGQKMRLKKRKRSALGKPTPNGLGGLSMLGSTRDSEPSADTFVRKIKTQLFWESTAYRKFYK